jgi:Mlc titration factor MtfA (ptsG expression regulator)
MPIVIIFIILFLIIMIGVRALPYYVSRNNLTINFNPYNYFSKRKLSLDSVNILSQYSNYYKLLPKNLKGYFEDRILKFLDEKEFILKSGLTLSREMKLLIADSAIKLTFGLSSFTFDQFEKLIIFKGEFYSDFSHAKEIGETNPAGAIVFSWKDLVEGDTNDKDGINLGVHEFAHALMVQNKGHESWDDEYFVGQIGFFENFYHNEKKLADVKAHHLFRDYAFRNKMEFFAVSCEVFFEVPVKMKEGLPELYSILCGMLNQDPSVIYDLNTANRRPE